MFSYLFYSSLLQTWTIVSKIAQMSALFSGTSFISWESRMIKISQLLNKAFDILQWHAGARKPPRSIQTC